MARSTESTPDAVFAGFFRTKHIPSIAAGRPYDTILNTLRKTGCFGEKKRKTDYPDIHTLSICLMTINSDARRIAHRPSIRA